MLQKRTLVVKGVAVIAIVMMFVFLMHFQLKNTYFTAVAELASHVCGLAPHKLDAFRRASAKNCPERTSLRGNSVESNSTTAGQTHSPPVPFNPNGASQSWTL